MERSGCRPESASSDGAALGEDRLIVHSAGRFAGMARLDISLPEFTTVNDLEECLYLLSGAGSPLLSPIGAKQANEIFQIAFFSPIFKGCNPQSLRISLLVNTVKGTYSKLLPVVSAEWLRGQMSEEEVSIPSLTFPSSRIVPVISIACGTQPESRHELLHLQQQASCA